MKLRRYFSLSFSFSVVLPLFFAAAVALPARSLPAAELVVEFFRSTFLLPSRPLQVGDDVRFQWIAGDHVVASGSGPDDPEAGQRFDVELNEANPTFTYTIEPDLLGVGLTFFDRRNPGRVGFIEVDRGETFVRVGVVDNVFLPEEVFIFAGDSVRWEHEFMEDFHTITSGLSSRPEDDPGALFDEESSCDRPIFEYVFETADTYPYFCRPHESMGMVGTVYVQEIFVRGDATGDEEVDLSDAVATLNFLFLGREARPCRDALDANDDGEVDISDPIHTLIFLFAGGERIPAPYPLAGGDRTPDSLLCMEPPVRG